MVDFIMLFKQAWKYNQLHSNIHLIQGRVVVEPEPIVWLSDVCFYILETMAFYGKEREAISGLGYIRPIQTINDSPRGTRGNCSI